jgi:hypothetical protein
MRHSRFADREPGPTGSTNSGSGSSIVGFELYFAIGFKLYFAIGVKLSAVEFKFWVN